MFTPSGEYSESRPFKIFISLLDKWEIGSPLTEALVYDALKAIRQHMTAGLETREDVCFANLISASGGILHHTDHHDRQHLAGGCGAQHTLETST